MREIKFRGLRTDGGGWVEGYYRTYSFYNKLGDEPKLIYTKHFIGSFDNLVLFQGIFEQVEVHPETVGQFTGLKDKNGKEIYLDDTYLDDDGDLFKVVELDCGRYALHLIGSNYIDEFVLWKQIEIIGNIHENK
jgi:hypothetical protein